MPIVLSGVNAESLAGYRVVLSSVLPGTMVDLPGDKLPDGCLWPERQLVKFKNYPDLKLIYEAGHLSVVHPDQAVNFLNCFVTHLNEDEEIIDGLYLPALTADTIFKPWSPNAYPNKKPGDIEKVTMMNEASGGINLNQVYQAKCIYVGRYVS